MERNLHDQFIEYMHDYLDEDIPPEHEKELKKHLQTCEECRQHFHELNKTIALIQSTSRLQAPAGFTEKVMMNLPREKKQVGVKRWFGRHPFLTAAAVFLILMTSSFISNWNQDDHFAVTKHEDLIIEDNNTAVVPAGKTIKGDIVVKNGNIRIEGKVEGNVTVINGSEYQASAGKVTGNIEVINQAFELLWHNIKTFFSDLTNVFSDNNNQEKHLEN